MPTATRSNKNVLANIALLVVEVSINVQNCKKKDLHRKKAFSESGINVSHLSILQIKQNRSRHCIYQHAEYKCIFLIFWKQTFLIFFYNFIFIITFSLIFIFFDRKERHWICKKSNVCSPLIFLQNAVCFGLLSWKLREEKGF